MNIIVKAKHNAVMSILDTLSTVELCSGYGRNIHTIEQRLKPKNFIAVDCNRECVLEIAERWSDFDQCQIKGV